MRNKIFIIKFIHTIVFFFMSACLIYILYCGITRTFNWLLLVAIAAIMVEGMVLLFNHGRCPFTDLAEKAGATSGSVTDLFLPDWIALNTFKFSTVLFIAELVLLAVRYFTGI
jgi:hypothetical protein